MSVAVLSGIRQIEIPWSPRRGPVTVGKDILELLSSSMYLEPLTIYREYIQNCADAIDDARRCGVLPARTRGRVDMRSEEHTSELQSHLNLVCRLLLEKKKRKDASSTECHD